MSAPDPLSKLKNLAKPRDDNAQSFLHESEEQILNKLIEILKKVPTGQELVDKANEYGTKIKLLKGQNEFSFSPETNTVFLGLPAGQNAPKARMLLYLAMGLEEARQEYEGMPRPPVQGVTRDQLTQIHSAKQEEILYLLCIISYEFIKSLGLREILDELTKMGHNDLYKIYESDVKEGHIVSKV